MKKYSLNDFSQIISGNPKFLFLRVNSRTCSTRYILRDAEKILLIDSGDGEDELDFVPDVCILTHCHYDHSGGVKTSWENTYYSKDENPKLPFVKIPKNAKGLEPKLSLDSRFSFGSFSLKVIKTPGHTYGGICLFEPKNKILFCGDTKFANGLWGRTDLGGSDEQIAHSLSTLDKLDWKILCPGHGALQLRDGRMF